MPDTDFIISILNLEPDMISSVSTVRKDDVLYIYFETVRSIPDCPYCHGPYKGKGVYNVHIKTLDNAGLQTILVWKRHRYICKDCGRSFLEENRFAPKGIYASYSLLNAIVNELRDPNMTFKAIAEKHHISSTSVQRYCDSFLLVPRQPLPEWLGIDEIHSDMAKYGGSYLAVLVDCKDNQLSEVLPDRSKRTLSRHFESIPCEERDKVLYVTIDMWEPYKTVALRYFKNCVVAVDSFHVVKELQHCFTSLRVAIMNQQPKDSAAYYLLKKWHRLLECDDYDLNPNKPPKYNAFFRQKLNYCQLYDIVLGVDPVLREAYYLKEHYRDFNRTATTDNCEKEFDEIFDLFVKADLPCNSGFVSMIHHWKQEILNSFIRPYNDRKLTNALTENMNGRIRTMIDVGNGTANFDRFRARALFAFNRHICYYITNNMKTLKREGKKRGSYKKSK